MSGRATAHAVRALLSRQRRQGTALPRVLVHLTGPYSVALPRTGGLELVATEGSWNVARAGGYAMPTGLKADHPDPLTVANRLTLLSDLGRLAGDFAAYERRQVDAAIRQGDLDEDAEDITLGWLADSWRENPDQSSHSPDPAATSQALDTLVDAFGADTSLSTFGH